jgi:hypothetical protein
MCEAMLAVWYWIVDHLDRILALIAMVIAAYAIWDVRKLFNELERRDQNTEKRVRLAVINELMTHVLSFAAFFRATQHMVLDPKEPDRVTAVTILAAFRLQQLLFLDASKEELNQLQKNTRSQVEETAKGYAEMLISSEMGKFKDGWDFSKPQSKT